MKIVRELENNVDYSIIKEIYEKGNKVALSYKENTSLGFENTIYYDKEGFRFEVLKDEFIIEKGEVFAKENNLIVIDKVVSDKCGDLGIISPYFDTGELSFMLYNDDGIIANNVYEVELD